VSAFYRHPVWLLNGLFIEQDPQSLAHRQAFTTWVTQHLPTRVADFGGGFGGVARSIGATLPHGSVEVVEPISIRRRSPWQQIRPTALCARTHE
jgi:hypothetical protein